VLGQHLGHLAADREVGVQRGHGVLEDHRDLLAADLVQLGRGQVQDLAAAVEDGAVRAAVAGEQAHDGEEDLGLARPALADDAQGLAVGYREVDAVGGEHLAVGGGEAGGQRADLEDGDADLRRAERARKLGEG
jgi:hypothetical protein